MEKSNEMIELEKKYNKVLECRNECCKNWWTKNRDKHNTYVRNYYNKNKTDADFMEKLRERSRINYQKKKEMNENNAEYKAEYKEKRKERNKLYYQRRKLAKQNEKQEI